MNTTPLTKEQQKVVMDNTKLVRFIIRAKCRIHPHRREEYFNTGVIGLCNAIRLFKPELGKFSSFAALHIAAAVQQDMDKEVREDCRGRYNRKERRAGQFSELQRNRSERPVMRLQAWRGTRQSEFGSEDGGSDPMSQIPDSNGCVETMVLGQEKSRLLRLAIVKANLKKRELEVLRMSAEGKTRDEIGQVIGRTRQRVCQIFDATVARIRANLDGVHHE